MGINIVTSIMQNRLVAEIPALPPSWRITFDLKRTGEEKVCCRNCASGILQVKGTEIFPWTTMPDIKYSCANSKSDPRKHSAGRRYDAVIRIAHWMGKFFQKEERKDLLLGKWSSFEISQATEKYKNKKRLMFKVNIVEIICKVLNKSKSSLTIIISTLSFKPQRLSSGKKQCGQK